jgi:uncharacterized protein (TIGR02145 family)
MKKILLLLITVVIFSSCKKNKDVQVTDPDPVPAEKVPVSFTVSGFSQVSGPITVAIGNNKAVTATATSAFTPPATIYANDKLIYVVYDSQGKEVSRLVQFKTSEPGKLYRVENDTRTLVSSGTEFGKLSDNLAVGTYTVVVTVGQTDASLNRVYEGQLSTDQAKAYPASTLNEAVYYPASGGVLGDSFFYKGLFSVTNNSNTGNFVLERNVGQLTFNFEDMLPSNAKYLSYDIVDENTYYKLSNNTPGGTTGPNGHLVGTVTLNAADLGKTNYKHSIFTLNTITSMTVVLTVWDANMVPLTTKSISGVRVNKNEQTTLTGKIFQATASNFTISLNQQWGANPSIVSFNPPVAGKVSINGTDYATTTIGDQTWTAVNYSGTGGLWYMYDSRLDPIYGKLYTAAEAAAVALPSGWRLPTKADYEKLMRYVGTPKTNSRGFLYIEGDETKGLKSTTGWETPGTNATGFNAVDGGYAFTSVTPGGINVLFSSFDKSSNMYIASPAYSYNTGVTVYDAKDVFVIENYVSVDGNTRTTLNTAKFAPFRVEDNFRFSLRFIKDN